MSAAKKAPAAASTRIGADTQEIRLATTMTGGVSLAIWMGGVAREIDLLLQASQWRKACDGAASPAANTQPPSTLDPIVLKYIQLIRLMDVLVDTDVLSGTSAGGINAVLLAIARTRGVELDRLRDIWMDVAALETLIRDPADPEIPSLLYGDKWMFNQLDAEIPKLKPATLPKRPDDAEPLPTTLFVTTTLLSGETGRFVDSFGTSVQDSDQRGIFTFTAEQLADRDNNSALALAARSTAAYPGAFEPSYLPYRDPVPATDGVPARPAMNGFANISRSHWVADGGLLNNRPINLVVDEVFRRPADRSVRRVLLYVVPSSGNTPDVASAPPADSIGAPYGLLDGVLREMTSRMSASIAADLRAIEQHNADMAARSELRLWIAEKHGKRVGRLLTPGVLQTFQQQVADTVAESTTESMLKVLSAWEPPNSGDAGGTVPATWVSDLEPGGNAAASIRAAVVRAMCDRFKQVGSGRPTDSAELGRYGRVPLDGAVSIALEVARTAEVIADAPKRGEIAKLVAEAHRVVLAPPTIPLDDLTLKVCADPTVRAGKLDEAGVEVAEKYATANVVGPKVWLELSEILRRAATLLPFLDPAELSLMGQSEASGTVVREAAARLSNYVTYLRLDQPAEEIMLRLFDLAVTERSLLPANVGPYQPVALVQASADTRCALVGSNRSTAQQKLTGMQFHHFGAFYKKSWRANDWMWGRLDGAGWLVHVLLDPNRVRHIVETQAPTASTPNEWFLDRLVNAFQVPFRAATNTSDPSDPSQPRVPSRPEVLEELEYLNDRGSTAPLSLPTTSLWLAQAWQCDIADVELPNLARTIVATKKVQVDKSPATSVSWAKQVQTSGADCAKLLATCPVPDETFKTDMGTKLMVKTVAKAAATTAGALDSARQIPAAIRPPIKTLRTITLGGYRIATWAKWRTWVTFIAGAGAVLAGLLVPIWKTNIAGLSPLLLSVIGAYVIVLAIWQWSYRAIGAGIAVAITGGIAYVMTSSGRKRFFGTSLQDTGEFGHLSHWLGANTWHPLVAIGVALLAMTIYGLVLARIPRLTMRAWLWLKSKLT